MKTVKQIAEIVGGIVEGSGNLKVSGAAEPDTAQTGDIIFLFDSKLLSQAQASKAAVVLSSLDLKIPSKTLIKVKNPRLAMAKILKLFEKPAKFTKKNIQIGKNTVIHPSAILGENVKVGNNTVIYPNVTIYPNCEIGSNCIIHSGAVIGADGFGFAQEKSKFVKIPQIGNVIIEDDVEIKSNVCIDRATLGSTLIKKGTKVDNLTHIAHNCLVGEDSVLTASVILGGSVELGDRVKIGGQTVIRDHVKIGSDTSIVGKSGVTKDLPAGAVISGFPAQEHRKELKEQAYLRRLSELFKRVEEIETKFHSS